MREEIAARLGYRYLNLIPNFILDYITNGPIPHCDKSINNYLQPTVRQWTGLLKQEIIELFFYQLLNILNIFKFPVFKLESFFKNENKLHTS